MEKNVFWVTIGGEKVYVSEDIYRAYVRPVRNEQRNNLRRARCRIGATRCQGDCSQCKNYKTGKPLSIDALMEEDGMDIPDSRPLVEDLIEQKLLIDALYEAIDRLPEKEKKAVLLFRDEATESEIGNVIGMTQQGAGKLLDRVWKKLAEELKEYR